MFFFIFVGGTALFIGLWHKPMRQTQPSAEVVGRVVGSGLMYFMGMVMLPLLEVGLDSDTKIITLLGAAGVAMMLVGILEAVKSRLQLLIPKE